MYSRFSTRISGRAQNGNAKEKILDHLFLFALCTDLFL